MLPTYNFGYDYGNTESTGVVLLPNGTHRHVTIPSYSAQGTLEELERVRSATGGKFTSSVDVLRDGEYVLSLGSSEVFIGSLALTQARMSSTGKGDISRYWSQRSLELLLTVAAALIPERDFRLNVVTGLPVETFTSGNRRQVKEALEGSHRFTLNGRPRSVDVRVSRVIMEGAGAVIAYGTAEQVKQGAIDIGGRTTDVFASEGQMPILPLCKGKALGVELAADLLSAQVQTHYLRPLSSAETRSVLRAYATKTPYPRLYSSGTRISELEMMTWTKDALRTIGTEIASFVAQSWNNSEVGSVASDVAKVLLVGGGAYYFQDELRKIIAHIEVPAHPELANAIGYAALADQVNLVAPYEPADAKRSRDSSVLPSTGPEREALAAAERRWPGVKEPAGSHSNPAARAS